MYGCLEKRKTNSANDRFSRVRDWVRMINRDTHIRRRTNYRNMVSWLRLWANLCKCCTRGPQGFPVFRPSAQDLERMGVVLSSLPCKLDCWIKIHKNYVRANKIKLRDELVAIHAKLVILLSLKFTVTPWKWVVCVHDKSFNQPTCLRILMKIFIEKGIFGAGNNSVA